MNINPQFDLSYLATNAPAAFATAPVAGVSNRYAHVNTSRVIGALMQDGWRVEQAHQGRSRRKDLAGHAKHTISLYHPELHEHREGRPQMHLSNGSDTTCAFEISISMPS